MINIHYKIEYFLEGHGGMLMMKSNTSKKGDESSSRPGTGLKNRKE